MKPKSAKAERKKLPKARVMFLNRGPEWSFATVHLTKQEALDEENDILNGDPGNSEAEEIAKPVLVLPMPTLKSAKARLKIEQMTQEELVEGVAKAICLSDIDEDIKNPFTVSLERRQAYERQARSILSFLGRSGT